MFRSIALMLAFTASSAIAQEGPTVVPFRLSRTQHIVVRVKIDGKGPFQFVVDTGCPVLVISTEAAKKAGLVDVKGVGVIKKLEFEGGLTQENVKARIETPFQIESMNNMGLPGIELHGLLGYTVLAKYKMEIDLAKERMIWTPLAFDPPPLERLKVKEGDGSSIEIMGGFLKLISRLTGLKPGPPPVARGFAGVLLKADAKTVTVSAVLDGSPAAQSGVKVGDALTAINGRAVASLAEANTEVAAVREGQELTIDVLRDGEKKTFKLKTAAGF